MKIRIALLFMLVFSSRSLLGLASQAAPRGRIEGVVRNKNTNEPVPGAVITLTRVDPRTGLAVASGGPGPSFINSGTIPTLAPPTPPAANPSLTTNVPQIPAVKTDARGQFVIPGLEPGAFRMSITSNGYVRQEYGQTAFLGPGALLELSPDQMSKQVSVLLTATGNVSGVLRDVSGNPVVGVPVQLVRRSYTASGQRIFQSVGVDRSNDRGEYRLYWVTPGRYYLAAGNAFAGAVGNLTVGSPVSTNDPRDPYMFTFYPGVTDPAIAAGLDIGAGEDIHLDIPMSRQETFRIRGRVVDSVTSRPPPSIGTAMTYAAISGGGGVLTPMAAYDPGTGAFEIGNVSAGKYWMTFASNGRIGGVSLDVVNNVDGLAIILSGPMSVAGRISMEGRPGSSLPERVRVQVKNTANGATSSELADTDGTFVLENLVAGEYRVSISSDGNTSYYMKSARFGRNDVLAGPLVIADSSQAGAPLDIVISSNVAQVEGVVRDDQVRPISGVQAVLIPQSDRDRTDLFRVVTTDSDGRFVLKNIVPGDYELFAWDALEPNGFFDLEFVKRYEQQGKPLHVGEASTSNEDLKVIRAER